MKTNEDLQTLMDGMALCSIAEIVEGTEFEQKCVVEIANAIEAKLRGQVDEDNDLQDLLGYMHTKYCK